MATAANEVHGARPPAHPAFAVPEPASLAFLDDRDDGRESVAA